MTRNVTANRFHEKSKHTAIRGDIWSINNKYEAESKQEKASCFNKEKDNRQVHHQSKAQSFDAVLMHILWHDNSLWILPLYALNYRHSFEFCQKKCSCSWTSGLWCLSNPKTHSVEKNFGTRLLLNNSIMASVFPSYARKKLLWQWWLYFPHKNFAHFHLCYCHIEYYSLSQNTLFLHDTMRSWACWLSSVWLING